MYKNIDNIHIVGKYKMYLYELYLTTMNVYCVYTAMWATTTKFSQKGKSNDKLCLISYSVYTVPFPFHKCLLRFALHKKEGTERLHVM